MSVFGTHIIFLIGIGFGTSNNFDFSNNFMKLGISGIQTFIQFIHFFLKLMIFQMSVILRMKFSEKSNSLRKNIRVVF